MSFPNDLPTLPESPDSSGEDGENLAGWAWVPIRSLAARHRERIREHLLSLSAVDRHLRFGYSAHDEQIARYAEAIDFERDEVFGIFNRRLELIAVAHLAYTTVLRSSGEQMVAEFGVSVLAGARGRGFGRRLFDHAALHARNRGVDTLFIYALSENAPMLRLARSAGATVERSGADSEAWLKLPPDTFGTHVDEAIEEHVAEMDYRWKVQLSRVNHILDAIAEVKSRFSRTARPATQ